MTNEDLESTKRSMFELNQRYLDLKSQLETAKYQNEELTQKHDQLTKEYKILLDAYNCFQERKQEQILVLLNNISKQKHE